MAITYTWDIQNLELIPTVGDNQDVVFRVVWQCTAQDENGNSKQQIGVVELDTDVPPENFINVESLTKEQIISWVKQKVAVKVVEDGLIPNVKTITLMGTTGTTVGEVLSEIEAKKTMTPDPSDPAE